MTYTESQIKATRDNYLAYIQLPSYDMWTAAVLMESYFEAIGRPDDFCLAFVPSPRPL